MSAKSKGYARKKGRSAPQFVMLEHWLLRCEAWATLKANPRALYVELKLRYNGANNGEIFLSQRDAATAICVNKDSVGRYFRELVERGFIIQTQGGHLGPSGIGQAAKWALTQEPLNGCSPTKDFIRWKPCKTPSGISGQRVRKIQTVLENEVRN